MNLSQQQRTALDGLVKVVVATVMLGLLWFILTGCAAKHIDPPTYTYDTPTLVKLSAQAHANDVRGMVYLVMPTGSMEPLLHGGDYIVVDIGMRMLTPRELFNAQGFPAEYVIDPEVNGEPLSKTAQVRMVGNSVSPVMARAIVAANVVAAEAAA